jgi:hypothetical protein
LYILYLSTILKKIATGTMEIDLTEVRILDSIFCRLLIIRPKAQAANISLRHDTEKRKKKAHRMKMQQNYPYS